MLNATENIDKRSEGRSISTRPWSDCQLTSAPKPLETMYLGAGDMDMFQLYASEMVDPTIFEGLNYSSTDIAAGRNTLWEGSLAEDI